MSAVAALDRLQPRKFFAGKEFDLRQTGKIKAGGSLQKYLSLACQQLDRVIDTGEIGRIDPHRTKLVAQMRFIGSLSRFQIGMRSFQPGAELVRYGSLSLSIGESGLIEGARRPLIGCRQQIAFQQQRLEVTRLPPQEFVQRIMRRAGIAEHTVCNGDRVKAFG